MSSVPYTNGATLNSRNFKKSLDKNPWNLPEYRSRDYERLDKEGNTIRVLKLSRSDPQNPEVECELIITPLSGNHKGHQPYEALSWCWGTATESTYVIIRSGKETWARSVKPDLFSALRALRRYESDRYLWIDAICIDQDNTFEKNHQVELMSEIYGQAERVCIWLGDPTESSQLALSFIENEVLQLQDFDDLCDKKADPNKWNALLELMQRPWFSRRWVVQEIALARKALIYCGTDSISWRKFAIAVELFVEVETATHRLSEVMKKDPKFYHVPGWFEYVSALGASLLVDATGRLFRDSKQLLDDDPDAEVETDREIYTDDESDSDGLHSMVHAPTARGQPLLSLEYLVSSLSIFDFSVEHDTIYALLAIAKDTTPRAQQTSKDWLDHTQDALEKFTQKKRYIVDYDQPYVDVCKFFIQFCIDRSLRTDPSRALDILFRPWAAEEGKILERRNAKEREQARIRALSEEMDEHALSTRRYGPLNPKEGFQRHKRRRSNGFPEYYMDDKSEKPRKHQKRRRLERAPTKGEINGAEDEYMPLPSWVPQLSRAPFAMYSQAGIPGLRMGRTNADPLVGLPSVLQRNYSAAENKGVDLRTFRFRKRANTEHQHFSMYVKGFVLDRIQSVRSSSQGGSIPSEWTEFGGWSGTPQKNGDPPDEFWRTLVADRGKDGKNPPVYYARACKESFDKGGYVRGSVGTTELINNERCSVVAQFCRRVQAVIWNRALIRTEKMGKLGLVGQDVKRDDLVCILYGCSVPVVLRKSEEKEKNVMQKEIDWEVEYLKTRLIDCCRVYLKRTRFYKRRRDEDQERYQAWESKTWKDWKRDKDWRREWNDCTKEQRENNRKLIVKTPLDDALRRSLNDSKTSLNDLKVMFSDLQVKENYHRRMKEMLWCRILRTWREFKTWKKSKKELLKLLNIVLPKLSKKVSPDEPRSYLSEQSRKILSEQSRKLLSEQSRKIMSKQLESLEHSKRKFSKQSDKELLEQLTKGSLDQSKKVLTEHFKNHLSEDLRQSIWDELKSIADSRKTLFSDLEKEVSDQLKDMLSRQSQKERADQFKTLQEQSKKKLPEQAKKKLSERIDQGLFDQLKGELLGQLERPKVNWRKFKLRQKYFLRWKRKVRNEKARLRKEAEEEIKLREAKRREAKHSIRNEAEIPTNSPQPSQEDPETESIGGKEYLTVHGKRIYEKKLRENVKNMLGPDAHWHYKLLGECYIHGMMDGEAMAVQNGNFGHENAKSIPTTVFEIR